MEIQLISSLFNLEIFNIKILIKLTYSNSSERFTVNWGLQLFFSFCMASHNERLVPAFFWCCRSQHFSGVVDPSICGAAHPLNCGVNLSHPFWLGVSQSQQFCGVVHSAISSIWLVPGNWCPVLPKFLCTGDPYYVLYTALLIS